MLRIGHIMTRDLVTVSPNSSIYRAIVLMEEYRIGSLPVVEDDNIVGIITSRDIRSAHPNRLVIDVMSQNVITVQPESFLWEAKELLKRHKIERLVAVEERRPIGIVTKAQIDAGLGRYTDSLTGLKRAEYLYWKAFELLNNGQEIVVIFLDMDNFGIIDKELGHVIGDQILGQVALVLNHLSIVGVDYLCRYAGDEFAIVTIRTLDESREFAWRIVTALSEERWPCEAVVSCSIGLAGIQTAVPLLDVEKKHLIEELVNMASLASTRAKREKIKVVVERVDYEDVV